MNEADTIAKGAEGSEPDQDRDVRAEWVAGQIADLARLRVLSMQMAERAALLQMRICAEAEMVEDETEARQAAREAVEDTAVLSLCMNRLERSVRRLVALEQEASGLRDPRSMQASKRRSAETARTLRASVAGGVRQRLPGADKESWKSLLSDLFRDYDDYDDYDRGDIAPLVERVAKRLGRLSSPGPHRYGDGDDPVGARINAELDRIAAYRREEEQRRRGADPDPHPGPRQNGHDPP